MPIKYLVQRVCQGAIVALALVALPAMALDINGFTRADDAACWLDAGCSLPRGGDSDVMTVYAPDGSIFAQIFAFGNEEIDNFYYFDPQVVPVDATQIGAYTTLLEPSGAWSDTFGVFSVAGVGNALGFYSDPQASTLPPLQGLTFVESPYEPNPVPEPNEDSQYLTVPYSATQYLSADFQALGYTATFQSDIPVPASWMLVALGLAGIRRFTSKH